MAEYFVPDEEDARVLRILIEREKKRNQGKGVPFEQDHVPTAPETYIALVPAGGIPGVEITPGTGTGTAESVGTNPHPGDGDRVNSASCDIYEIRNVRSGSGFSAERELISLGFSEEVYNLSTETATRGYTLIHRDKFGRFVLGSPATTIIPDIYGQALTSISYGGSGTIYLWSNGLPTEPSRYQEDVLFDFLGKSGDTIAPWTLVEARWWADLNDGAGGYRVSNSNCDPETVETGTGTG